MSPPELSNTINLTSTPPSDASIATCGDQTSHDTRPPRRWAGLASSSVVHPPEIPQRDAMSLSMGDSNDETAVLDDGDKQPLADDVCSANEGTAPSVQRLQPTTSTAPPPSGGELPIWNAGSENAQPGAFRVSGFQSGSVGITQIRSTHQEDPSRTLGLPVSSILQPTAFRPLVDAFLVEGDPPTAKASSRMDASTDTQQACSAQLKQEEDNDLPVSVVQVVTRQDRSFCDLLKDWRVLVLIFFFLMIIVGMAVGPGIYGGLNSSPKKSFGVETAEPRSTRSPSNMTLLPVATPAPINSSLTSSPTSRITYSMAPSMTTGDTIHIPSLPPTMKSAHVPTHQPVALRTKVPTKTPPTNVPTWSPTSTPTVAPTFRPTKAPTRESYHAYPTQNPTKKPNSYYHDKEPEEHDDD
eukprot:Nitzschia sp. Nitz4//scaffold233_size31335//29578//30810//NITZ4_007956-RA/size31335-processed-gene-0.4-mRNA-1//1//CDS//3329543394//1718//frame0